MKNIFLLFTIVLILNASLFADGTEPEGNGSETNPYQIVTLDNLLWLSTTVTPGHTYIIQISDIDASETENWNNGEGFIPIGPRGNFFEGNYNGLGHTISNLYISRGSKDYQGLFGTTVNSVIENLTITDFYIYGKDYVGGLIGFGFTTKIINCTCENIFLQGKNKIGGMAGKMYVYDTIYGHPSITNSNCTGVSIVSTQDCIGGLIGSCGNTKINNCKTVLNIKSYGDCVGGLIGECSTSSTISNCSSIVEIDAEQCVGGLVGRLDFAAIIKNCFTNGNIIAERRIGGLVGYNLYNTQISNCYSTCDVSCSIALSGGFVGSSNSNCIISNCYSTGTVLGSMSGGFAGEWNSVCENNFWDMETSGKDDATSHGCEANITGKTHAEMLDIATFTDTTNFGLEVAWDFIGNPNDDIGYEDVWNIDGVTNNGYPFIADAVITQVYYNKPVLAETALLQENYPNPFSSTTTFSFTIKELSIVTLEIYNLKGEIIRTLSNKQYPVGDYSILWNGKDDKNKPVSPGVYFCRLKVNYTSISVKKCILTNY